MKISQLMHKDAITCRTADSLDRAAQLMWDHDIGALPVIDDQDRVVGIVTDRDICMAAYTRGAPLTGIPVTVAMATGVISCTPDDEVLTAEKKMSEGQVRRIPIVDRDGHALGMLSLNDIARASARTAEVTPRELASTLAAVCQPRQAAAAAA